MCCCELVGNVVTVRVRENVFWTVVAAALEMAYSHGTTYDHRAWRVNGITCCQKLHEYILPILYFSIWFQLQINKYNSRILFCFQLHTGYRIHVYNVRRQHSFRSTNDGLCGKNATMDTHSPDNFEEN